MQPLGGALEYCVANGNMHIKTAHSVVKISTAIRIKIFWSVTVL